MVHLHVHNHIGSFLDSIVRVPDLIKRCKELNMPAVALTDHGYCSNLINHYKECKANGIKPILGVEMYLCEDINVKDKDSKYWHIILLAKNIQGYKNILKLSSIGFTEGFYYKNRIDFETLKKYKDGIVVLSACLGSQLGQMILDNVNQNEIDRIALQYKHTFNDYYLEIQSANTDEQCKASKVLADMSNRLDIPLVVSSDVHFIKQEDYEYHGVFIKVSKDITNEHYQDCWLKTEEEVFNVISEHIGFDKALEAISNTHSIADMCNVELELGNSYLPDFPIPKEFDNDIDYLRHLCDIGFGIRRINHMNIDDIIEYNARFEEEFEIITKKGYTGYFLIVQDFLKECRKNDIYLGDGRGSADNSLVCYLLNITNVDPVKYDLEFSRFLTIEREELPD